MKQQASIGLMSFTIRKHMKTKKQIKTTLERLSGLNVNYLELAYIKWKKDTVLTISESCKALDIRVLSSQIKYKTIIKDYDNILTYLRILGCETLAVSVLPYKYILKGEQGIRDFAVLLNDLGLRMKKDGIQLLYHHHHMEFAKYRDKTGLDILMSATNPDYVNLEMDVYWTQKGGKNPLDIIDQYNSRIKVIHLRDYKVTLKVLRGDYLADNCSLGKGNLNIDGIVKKAMDYSIPFIAFEEDTKTPFESIQDSFEYLTTLGYSYLLKKV